MIRGGNLFSGYWPDGVDGPDEDGWYRTGDVGYLDADGDLFLVDRLRELIIVSGFNVFPSEVEEVLVGAPGVREAAVIGVPSEETGEAVKAFVVPETGATVDRPRSCEYAGTRLARFKCPVEIEVVDHLPHSVTGKVAKGQLRSGPMTRVTLYGKPGCHLCDDARAIVQPVCAELGVGLDRGRHHAG